MSYFEYSAVYFGIIVGIALTDILSSIHKLLGAAARVRWGWMAPLSAGYAATLTLGEFWSVWVRQHELGHRTLLTWLPLAIAFALLFLMCAASLPDEVGEHGVDLAAYYDTNRRRFWGIAVALHLLNLASWITTFSEHGFAAQTVYGNLQAIAGNTIEGALSLSLVFVRATWWNAVALALLWGYVLAVFGPMPLA